MISDRYRRKGVNLGTQLKRFIKRAGLSPWPRVWHNLRASCQTELSARFPLHVVCHWLGNTTTVATQHYLTVRESDYSAALKSEAASPSLLQKAVQHTAEIARTGSHEGEGQNDERLAVQAFTNGCEPVHSSLMPPEGLQQYRETTANQGAKPPSAAECGAVSDKELVAVLAAWPRLSAQARAGVAGLAAALVGVRGTADA